MIATVAVLLAIAAILFTLSVRRKDVPQTAPASPTTDLEGHRATIRENLKDLQFEYQVGKLSEADYQQARQELQMKLARVTAEIEGGGKAPVAAPVVRAPVAAVATACPRCGASFDRPLKFCGECGAPMTGGQA
jgi:cytochrome c-type biogenesis protein CcmI